MPIDVNKINYLSLEGGGGKGIIYLGAIQALEEKFRETKPVTEFLPDKDGKFSKYYLLDKHPKRPALFPIMVHPSNRQLKGISGASAGAITAFMLAMGMNSAEIEEESNRIEYMQLGGIELAKDTLKIPNPITLFPPLPITYWYLRNKKTPVSPFELFLDDPDVISTRAIINPTWAGKFPGYDVEKRAIKYQVTLTQNQQKIQGTSILLLNHLLEPLLRSIGRLTHNTLVKKLLSSSAKPMEHSFKKAFPAFYFNSLMLNRGLFTGHGVRKYFEGLVERYLFRKLKDYAIAYPSYKSPKDLTFKEFFYLTGTDLVIAGTNVSQHRSMFFSVHHTPDFPVTEAVGISMSIPLAFKPVYVNTIVHIGKDPSYNQSYTGLWVDGGMLNNLPIHAFYKHERTDLDFHVEPILDYPVASSTAGNRGEFNTSTLGIRIGGENLTARDFQKDFPNHAGTLFSYAGDLIGAIMAVTMEEGHLTSPEAVANTITLDSGDISMFDFGSPAANKLRGEGELADMKVARSEKAYKDVSEYLTAS